MPRPAARSVQGVPGPTIRLKVRATWIRLGPCSGSGFLIHKAGYILTNNHVIEAAQRITVTLADGRSFKASVVGADAAIDIALLRIEGASDLPEAPLGNSNQLRVGEWVCAIGNPLGYVHSVTVGVVGFVGRKLYDPSLDNYIQTDAAINFGNSGGPLINTRGEVVGINAAVSPRTSSIGFAVPINQAVAVLPQLKSPRAGGARLHRRDPHRRDAGPPAGSRSDCLAGRGGTGHQRELAGRARRPASIRRRDRRRRPSGRLERRVDSRDRRPRAGHRRQAGQSSGTDATSC